MALFCDFENVAIGVRDANYAQFDIGKVLERLLLKGSIVVKKAYCDWSRYKEFRPAMHEASFELIEIPHVRQSGKNSADIRIVVDALDLCYTKEHVDTFVIISGDSDFSPLVSKLRENNKVVIGVGVKKATSDLLINNCDEFIFYDDLVRPQPPRRKSRSAAPAAKPVAGAKPSAVGKPPAGKPTRGRTGKAAPAVAADASAASVTSASPAAPGEPGAPAASAATEPSAPPASTPATAAAEDKKQAAWNLIVETYEALVEERGEGEKIWGSMIKQTLKRRKPGFSESYYGFRSFGQLLEEAEAKGILQLERDEKSGGFLIKSCHAT
ncbi:MAG: NYN domain-containing protein [Planctomycetota bacterium]|nr:NYN domain-containing protein [Planctomycetota bacterium]